MNTVFQKFIDARTDQIIRRIVEIYRTKGLEQQDFAKLMGYTQGKVSHTETGRNKLSVEYILRAAKVLGVHPVDLMLVDTGMDKEDLETLLRLHEAREKKDPIYHAIQKLLKK